jgi:acyl-CoA thioesterase-1
MLVTIPARAATILVVGDSLSAAYGIPQQSGWVALLAERSKAADHIVVNASVSGETSAGGLARIDAELRRHRPKVVILALGANDGLRGLPISELRTNLSTMVVRSRRAGARVVLAGMRLPPNYGAYARSFDASFDTVAKASGAALVPFLLDGIAADPRHFQPDGLHPTAAAQARILDNIWPVLAPLLNTPRNAPR